MVTFKISTYGIIVFCDVSVVGEKNNFLISERYEKFIYLAIVFYHN